MGRYYTTTTGQEGKFGFGCQNSDAPEKFGAQESTNVILYVTDKDDFNVEYLSELLDYFKIDIDINKEYDIDDIEDELYKDAIDKDCEKISDLILGLIIYSDIKEQGYCDMEAGL